MYWTLGGTFGLDTIDGEIEEAGGARNAMLIGLVAVVTVIKAAGALFALALVRPWGSMLGWLATAVLMLYGGSLSGLEVLFEIRVTTLPGDIDWKAFHSHLYL
jgi:hypothetical protein